MDSQTPDNAERRTAAQHRVEAKAIKPLVDRLDELGVVDVGGECHVEWPPLPSPGPEADD